MRPAAAAAGILLLLPALARTGEVTTRSLLSEMADLDRLSFPADYRTVQFSSYDRAASPRDPFANGDLGHYLRREGGEFVLAEAEGPGAIVRIWSANPGGRVKIFLDGEKVLEKEFHALLSGRVPPFAPPFGALRSAGGNLYFPFPFSRSMKVTAARGGQYYHVGVRLWPAGASVKTFSPADAKGLPALRPPAPRGERTAAPEVAGPGVVRRLEVALPEDPKTLRERSLRIFADGALVVNTPLGDFFGTAPGRTPYEALPMGITREGTGWCAFPMGFEKSLRVEAGGAATAMWVERGPAPPLRFHAFYRGAREVETAPPSEWSVLRAGGRGRLVGCFLSVRNPVRNWWGEGDEKIYVDGEEFPGIYGTGTEDYFGYAWCSPARFEAPYHNQTRCDGPANRGFTANARFHLLDDVPFQRSIRFDLEVLHHVPATIGLSTVAYFYAEPPCRHDFREPDPLDRGYEPLSPLPAAAGPPGAIEGETLEGVETTSGVAVFQDLSWTKGFSGGAHLWWRDASPGGILRLRFDAPAGRRLLALAFTKAPDYGRFRLRLNGEPLGEEVDLYSETIVPSELLFQTALREGRNDLSIEITGTNPKASPKNHMLGLDYLRMD